MYRGLSGNQLRKDDVMLSIVKSIALHGLQGYLVNIQVDISAGMPAFEIVGLPDTSIREAKERVKTAIRNSTSEFLSRKIVVNLAPASTKKEGSIFDLPIAVGILIANGFIYNADLTDTVLIGGLSLDGSICSVKGVLPICIEAKRLGIKRILLPRSNAKEASIIQDLEIIPISNLNEVIDYLNGNFAISPEPTTNFISENHATYEFDFSEVKGQENVKRALEISAAGGHNCLLIRQSWLWKNDACTQITFYFA